MRPHPTSLRPAAEVLGEKGTASPVPSLAIPLKSATASWALCLSSSSGTLRRLELRGRERGREGQRRRKKEEIGA